MADFVGNGGCVNGIRFANDGAGQGARDWIAAVDTSISGISAAINIIVAISFDSDDMNSIDGDFELHFQDDTDVSGYAAVASGSGEIRQGTGTDLIDDNAVISAERNGSENCSGMGVTHLDGVEAEGDNLKLLTNIADGGVFDIQWAVDLAFATPDHVYSFRVTDGSGSTYKTFTATVTVITPGEIDGITKNADRTAVIGGVTVTAYESDGAGSDPKPIGAHVGQVVSNVTTGVYSITGLASGNGYFLHFYKDDTNDLSDGSPEVTAVAV